MTSQAHTYGAHRIEYEVLLTPTRKEKIAIHVHPDGSVQVDAPNGEDLAKIHRAVTKRARWIRRHVDEALSRLEHVFPKRYVIGMVQDVDDRVQERNRQESPKPERTEEGDRTELHGQPHGRLGRVEVERINGGGVDHPSGTFGSRRHVR